MQKVTKISVEGALAWLLAQWGLVYSFGVENDNNVEPKSWDCSELVQIVYSRILGITVPDGARYQYEWCQKNGQKVEADYKPLDLVFLWDRDKIGQHIGHVALVFGEVLPVGGTLLIEARGKPWSHVMFTPLDKFKAQFGERVAGMFRLVELESLREPV